MKSGSWILRTVSITFLLSFSLHQGTYAESSVLLYGAVHQTWIKPLPYNPGAEFGNSIAMDGNTVVVGARHDNTVYSGDTLYYLGAVYVYTLNNNIWSLQARLLPEDPEFGAMFGSSVDIFGDTVVIGATGSDSRDEDGATIMDMGAVYVFTRNGDKWEQQAKIKPQDGGEDDNFGNEVAIFGERIVVGAVSKDMGKARNTGKVYSFYRRGSKWYPTQSINPPSILENAAFGSSLDYDGQRLVVGAKSEVNSGAAYVFYRIGGTWIQEAKLEPDGDFNLKNDNFGASVSLDSHRIVVGAPFSDPDLGDGKVTNAGITYVYRKNAGSWKQEARLVLENAAVFDQFGESVTIEGNTIIVGASEQDYFGILRAGAAHVFKHEGDAWQLDTRVFSGAPYTNGAFGTDLILSDGVIIVSEPAVSTISHAGSIHVYRLQQGILPETGYPLKTHLNAIHQTQHIPQGEGLQIEIPEIGTYARIVSAPHQGNTWNVQWLLEDVGYLEGSAYPTSIGNTVIAGHVNLPDGSVGPFARIDQLRWGDQILLHLNGGEYTYEVRNLFMTTPSDLNSLAKMEGYDWLTLITCSDYDIGTDDYSRRIILVAVRVK